MVAINEFLEQNFMTDTTQLRRIVEAALLAAAQPLSLPQLSALFGENEAPAHEDIARVIEELTNDCSQRGVELVEVASGFRYQIKQDVHTWVARLWTETPDQIFARAARNRLRSLPYRQPIMRAEIEGIRGVAVSSNMVKTLEEREWIRVVGYRDVPGKPALFGTTRIFLDYFNLEIARRIAAARRNQGHRRIRSTIDAGSCCTASPTTTIRTKEISSMKFRPKWKRRTTT